MIKQGNQRSERMKTVVIRDIENKEIGLNGANTYEIDLLQHTPKDCIGCWNCWMKTPGRCAHSDLNTFYKEYIAADKVIILTKASRGFVSSRLKTLLDRLIPLYLPYVVVDSGESRHLPRYDKYPAIEVYYEGTFMSVQGEEVFKDYLKCTFDHFASKEVSIEPLSQWPYKADREVSR